MELFITLSLAGILSLLSEPEEKVKVFALNRLDQLVDDFWAEIAESVSNMYVVFLQHPVCGIPN